MPRVLVSDTLSEQGLNILKSEKSIELDYKPGLKEAELAEAIVGADALLIRSGSKVTARVLEAADKLKVIGRAGIGVDNVDVKAASKRGIVVMNTPTGNAVTTAEHAISLLFSIARHIPEANRTMKAGKWDKKRFSGRELAGKTLGVIGLGNIGRIVADRAQGLKMRVLGFDPVVTKERAAEIGIELASLETIWAEADAITVHTPLTDGTRGLVNKSVLPKLKKGVLLVNCARGGIYDEDALLEGLESGQLGGVALDVFTTEPPPADSKLVAHERVVATPHLGASTEEAQERVALEIADQVVAYLKSGEIKNAVNTPSVSGEIAAKLAPYTALARKLGAFAARAGEVPGAKTVEVECVGEPAELSVKAITANAVSGFLNTYLDEHVNEVSAPPLAADRGITVTELRTAQSGGRYASQVAVRVIGEGKACSVQGTLSSDRSPRITKWDDFEIEASLEGATLVVINADRPGVIGFLGSTLGKASINVRNVSLGRHKDGRAVSVWTLDHAAPDSVLAELRASSDVSQVVALTF
jgi:D-3-phosphoglycerate dehydrogenase